MARRSTRRAAAALVLTLIAAHAHAQVAQNPSPMSDRTRPHPRVTDSRVPGLRATLSLGELFIPDGFGGRTRAPLMVHFHGAPWLVERHLVHANRHAMLVTIQAGAGSARYAAAFADAARFPRLLEEARERAAALLGRPVEWSSVTLTSFSAGYGATRAILLTPEGDARVSGVVLADGLHASYELDGNPAAPRATDPPVDRSGLDVFIRFAREAMAGRKRMWITHSEVYPGTYASTTETADTLLSALGLTRTPVLKQGPIGMQQLSETRRGGLLVAGFAGNSAPDHLDHLYALGDWLRRWSAVR